MARFTTRLVEERAVEGRRVNEAGVGSKGTRRDGFGKQSKSVRAKSCGYAATDRIGTIIESDQRLGRPQRRIRIHPKQTCLLSRR